MLFIHHIYKKCIVIQFVNSSTNLRTHLKQQKNFLFLHKLCTLTIMSTVSVTIIATLILMIQIAFVQSDNDCAEDCQYCLTNDNFSDGTYRIIESGKYCLYEDIIFNPRQPEDISSPNGNIYNWYPGEYESDLISYPGTLEYIARMNPVNGPFAGGFFSAISIETVDIEIDLNGYSISQHPYFYTQQRFYSNIEIQNKPYDELSKRTTGIWMWGPNAIVDNIYIHNGELGLSSHHGIHSNGTICLLCLDILSNKSCFDYVVLCFYLYLISKNFTYFFLFLFFFFCFQGATNVVIEDLLIHDFEVGGIQFNDFANITLRNIDIGPSATNVKLNGYYGNARYDLLTLHYLNHTKPENDYVMFSDGRNKTLLQIENDLITTMDIAFRYANDILTEEDITSEWYQVAMDLFSNQENGNIPDGSTIYGVVFNSFLDAVQGFGQSNQYGTNEDVDIKGVIMENIHIHDLQKSVNEVPGMYMNRCYEDEEEYGYDLYDRRDMIDVVRTPLGAVMDLRLMIDDGYNVLDHGILATDKSLYNEYLRYKGNVLSDAQISIKLYDIFKSRINTIMEDWATEVSDGGNIDYLPECMEFVCNSDVIFQTNKGIIGVRIDEIENVEISDLTIDNLYNLSPLGSNACGNYSGQLDGGNPWQINGDGNMNGHVRGISIYGSHIKFNGNVNINNLYSSYGDVYGIHIMRDSLILFGDEGKSDFVSNNDGIQYSPLMMSISQLYPENELAVDELDYLLTSNKSPYPNNFHGQCNILIDSIENNRDFIIIDPPLPFGVDVIECASPDNLPQIEPHTVDDSWNVIDVEHNKNDEVRLNYINIIYIAISVIFIIAITAIIFCIIYNYRKYIKNTWHTTDLINGEEELTSFIIHNDDNYGTIPSNC